MKIGFFGINFGVCGEPVAMIQVAKAAEQTGLESVWTGKHVVLPDPRVAPSPSEPQTPFLDPVVALSHIAAHTVRLRLGTGVIILPQPAGIERGKAEIDQFAVDEVADFDSSDRRLRDIGSDTNVNSLLFAPVIVNEDRATVAIDLARAIAHAHTDGDAFAVANIRAPIRLSADPARPAPVDAAKGA